MDKPKFIFFEHTADAEFKAFGKTLEEAFSNSAEALFSLMFNDVGTKEKREIHINGEDKKSLLYNFLEELLFLVDSEGFVTSSVANLKIQENSLYAKLMGDNFSNLIHSHGEVKAITYNSMKIGKQKDLYYVQVVVDM